LDQKGKTKGHASQKGADQESQETEIAPGQGSQGNVRKP
jgi:hypothetical protein